MNSQQHILQMMRHLDRILGPLRDFERLSGRGAQQIAQDFIRREQLFHAALPDPSSSYRTAIECLQPALDHFREFERHSSAMASLADAHRSISAVITKQLDLESIARASVILSPHWQDSIAAYQRLGTDVAAGQLALKSHYTSVAESVTMAQERLLRLPWESLGSATTIANVEFVGVRSHFTGLAETYRSLMQSFEAHEHFMASFPPLISAGPPLEILTSVNVLASLSRTPEVSDADDFEFEDEHDGSIDELLAALNPALPSVWAGAKEALRSENPDRGRHVAVSLRELITHVLDMLAPPAAVQGWTSDPSHFHDGRPTREARVLFACRRLNHGPFSKFVSADVRATVEFIALFQRGTHELAAAFTAAQLRALVARAGSLLRFLLLVSRI
jgi:hypothetical protein